jgi:protein TonB
MSRRTTVLALLLCGSVLLGGTVLAEEVEGFVAARPLEKARVDANYPPAALKAGYEASVVLAAEIGSDGTVGDVRIMEIDYPSLGFEAAAVAAIEDWRFDPALLDGQPVDSFSYVRLSFRVPGSRLEPRGHVTGGVIAGSPRLEGLVGGISARPGTELVGDSPGATLNSTEAPHYSLQIWQRGSCDGDPGKCGYSTDKQVSVFQHEYDYPAAPLPQP